MAERIYLSPPHQTGNERRYLEECLDLNWIAPAGPHLERLERMAARATGCSRAVAVASGTAALHLALIHLGVGSGDTVLCSTLTFCASANPIRYQGAEPIFVDSDPATWNIDPNLVEDELRSLALQGKRPKAIIAVDLFGQCADLAALEAIGGKYGVPVIEDAAESLGASFRGAHDEPDTWRPAGSGGWASLISLNGNKIITAGGGGLLCTDDARLAKAAAHLSTQARDPAPHYQHSQVGYNYRMSNVTAAIGIAQFEALPDRVAARRAIYARYCKRLGALPGVTMMPEPTTSQGNRWLTTLLIDPAQFGADREAVRLALEADNIESRPVWKPLHEQPTFLDCRCRGGDVAERLFRQGLCLPSGSAMTPEQQNRVMDIVEAARQRRSQAA
ncbi:MAG: aminotransferase class I/II-fold pyridoxal phosphate-dependent enzyme [Planctomycetales bacterium]|nr:aminotransferase class I/II-fold pyridoxal phosphate-dependent enzyme [Planctomycetales bacterium]